MSWVCKLTGKRGLVGNRVSHANNKTKRVQKPNLHVKRIYDPLTKRTVKLKLSTSAIRTIDKMGLSLTAVKSLLLSKGYKAKKF